MITYLLSRVHHFIREAVAPIVAPPRITLTRTRYLVAVNDALHHVRRDGVCDCGGDRQHSCPAIPLVRDYLAAGGARPLGRHPDTWPQGWLRVPPLCPVCDCPTRPDPDLDSRAGPGWQCSLTGSEHFWQVRMNPLRRYLAAHPPQPRYPWNGDSPEEQKVWLEAHTHLPRVVPSRSNGGTDALDRKKKSQTGTGT